MQNTVKIFVVHYREDDPRKCTALRMARAGLARLVSKPPRGSILLDPYAEQPISLDDRMTILSKGLTVVDASWNKLQSRKIAWLRRHTEPRRLPFLIAVNPPHYGKPYKLSSLEAVAAALYITGFDEEAIKLLSLYKWGIHFINVNKKYLELYREARNMHEILEVETQILGAILDMKLDPRKVQDIIRRLASSDETL